jgi:Skp family chaperone for outer membrane proteins
MKNIFRTILPAVLLMTFLSGSALAQTKVGTVDLRKLFDNYWKTKQAQIAIQQRAAQLDKDDKSMKDDLKKSSDDYQKLLDQASDQAISADERNKRRQAAESQLKLLEDSKAAIEQFERQAQATLTEQRSRMRENVLADIQAAVSAKAKAGGYTLVIDTAAETVNGTTTVVYNSGADDLTDTILGQLNVGAPIDVTSPASTMMSAPSLMGTNR